MPKEAPQQVRENTSPAVGKPRPQVHQRPVPNSSWDSHLVNRHTPLPARVTPEGRRDRSKPQ